MDNRKNSARVHETQNKPPSFRDGLIAKFLVVGFSPFMMKFTLSPETVAVNIVVGDRGGDVKFNTRMMNSAAESMYIFMSSPGGDDDLFRVYADIWIEGALHVVDEPLIFSREELRLLYEQKRRGSRFYSDLHNRYRNPF